MPTGNAYTALMATVTNNTGATLNSLALSYALTEVGTNTEVILAHQVYSSTTGLSGSWTAITGLSGITSGSLSTTISVLNWTTGSNLYVLWADDNGTANPDRTYALDNVSWTGSVAAVPEPSTYGLIGAGSLAAAAFVRRRKAKLA
jgi:hypothetical protein